MGAQKACTLKQLEQIGFYKDTPTSNDYLDVFIGQKHAILESLKRYENEIKCNCDGCRYQEECKYGHVVYDEFENSKMALWEKFHAMHAQHVQMLEKVYLNRNECLKKDMDYTEKLKVLESINEALDDLFDYCNSCGKCGKAYLKFNLYIVVNKEIKQELKKLKGNL